MIKPLPWSTCLFNMLRENNGKCAGSPPAAHLNTMVVSWDGVASSTTHFVQRIPFSTGKFFQVAGKFWLIILGYLADISSEMKEVNLSLQGKLLVFVANDKI